MRLILLVVMLAMLAILLSIYTGYIDFEPPALAEQFAPTPTPTRPPLLYIVDGDTYFAEGKVQAAIEAYEQAIQLDPTNDISHIRQARLLIYTHDTGKAVDRAAQAVTLNPDSPENLAYYCRALDWEARYAEAFEVCSCATELDPTYAEGYAFLSEVYADLGNWRAARENAQQAIDLNFQSMDAHFNMGYALEIQGRYAEALEFYENAVKLGPNLAPLYMKAGRIYQHGLGDYDTAIDYFKKAIKLSPFDPEPYDLLGWAYYFQGEYFQAIDALEQSMGIDPNYVNPYRPESAWGHLATVYYTRQNFEQATEFFAKAIELGEDQFLKRARQVEILTEIETLTGPETIPILRGRFVRQDGLHYVAKLQPIQYVVERDFESDQSCGQLIADSIQTEPLLVGATQTLTFTRSFSQTDGTATLNLGSGNLLLNFENLSHPPLKPYEIQMTFWPNRVDQVGSFQPDANQKAAINIQFDEKLEAPIEYYYQLGLAFSYLDLCPQAIPWLLKALEIDRSAYNPAWYGLRDCPSPNSPPTPIPTFTPAPEAGE